MTQQRTVLAWSVGACLLLALSCSGVELESEATAGASGEGGTGGSTTGTGGSPAPGSGGKGGTGTSPATGATGSSVGGATGGGARAGASGRGGGTPVGGRVGRGGNTAVGAGGSIVAGGAAGRASAGGEGGQPLNEGGASGMAGAPESGGGAATWCDGAAGFSSRMDGVRCESTESYAQGPNYERVDGATDIVECLAACTARPDCTAVSDYFKMRPTPGCYIGYESCDTLSRPLWAEENGAVVHKKVCAGPGDCSFERIPDFYKCGDFDGFADKRIEDAESIEDCKAACLADPDCASVNDYFYGVDVPGCYLNLGSCDAPFTSYQDGALYVKCN